MICKTEHLVPLTFSVIIPLYNKEKSVYSTIESVLNQSYPNFELIIVNDGSTDDSLRTAKSFKDERVYIINGPNRGVSAARNLGVKESHCKYIAFLDADDIWFSNCLYEFCELINNFPKASVFATSYTISGRSVQNFNNRYYVNDFYLTSAIFMAKWNMSLLLTGCVALEKSCLGAIGLYNETITHGEDIDLWIRLAGQFTVAKSEVVTTLYRIDAENRATCMREEDKKHLLPKAETKHGIKNKSQQLFYGCKYLNIIITSIRHRQNIEKPIRFLKYWDWITRAAMLYVRYRFLNLIRL